MGSGNISVSKKTFQLLKAAAEARNMSIAQLVESIVEAYVPQDERGPARAGVAPGVSIDDAQDG